MNIQTISIVVPTPGCVNKCKFCVSRMHCNNYTKHFDEFQITKRIKWAVMNNVNTCIITGTGEALQNQHFIGRLSDIFRKMNYPFPNVEIQTTGVMLDNFDYHIDGKSGNQTANYFNIFLLKELGVNTISLSVSDIWDDDANAEIIGMPEKLRFKLNEMCKFIKEQGFNLRLSLNMLKSYDKKSAVQILERCKELGADQITFRKMYYEGAPLSEQAIWTMQNMCKEDVLNDITAHIVGYNSYRYDDGNVWIKGKGHFLYTLPFGAKVYSIDGMSVVMDDDCMSKENNTALKYVILRENGKLYAQWDDEGSLIF